MKRREALALIPAASLAAQPHLGRGPYAVLEQLCERLIPSESGSPGAREARVAWYIDTVLRYATPATQRLWTEALRRLGPEVTDETMRREAAAEDSFLNTTLKPLAIEAYCLSSEGQRALGYRGNRTLGAFPGCAHAEHE
jgi:Gluconate 2-dehydrogenase subunit 3